MRRPGCDCRSVLSSSRQSRKWQDRNGSDGVSRGVVKRSSFWRHRSHRAPTGHQAETGVHGCGGLYPCRFRNVVCRHLSSGLCATDPEPPRQVCVLPRADDHPHRWRSGLGLRASAKGYRCARQSRGRPVPRVRSCLRGAGTNPGSLPCEKS